MIKHNALVSELRLMQLIILTSLIELKRLCKILNIDFYAIAGTLLGAYRHGGFIPWDSDCDVAMMREDYEVFIKKANEHIDEKFEVQSDLTHENNRTCFSRIRIKNTIINEKKNKLNEPSGFYIDIFPIDKMKNKPTSFDIFIHKAIKIMIRAKAYKNGKIYSSSKLRSLIGFIISLIFLPIPKRALSNFIENYMKRHQHIDTDLVTNYNSKYGLKKQTMFKRIYGVPKKNKFEGIEIPIPNDSELWLSKIYGNYMNTPPCPSLDLNTLMPSYNIDFGNYSELINKNEDEIRIALKLPQYEAKL